MATWFGKDLARMFSATTGDSDITLTTAVPGCKTFSQANIADSDIINYGIITYDTVSHRPVGSEVGLGKYISSGTILQRTTILSSISLDSNDVMDSQITLTGLSEIYIPFLEKDILRVKESDSDPNVYPVHEIIVSSGKLTDNGNGSISLDLSGGGAGATKFAVANYSGVDTVNNGANGQKLTVDTEWYDADNLISFDSDASVVVAEPGWYELDVVVDVSTLAALSAGSFTLTVANSSANSPNLTNQYPTTTNMDNEFTLNFNQTLEMAANDTIDVYMDNVSGQNLSVIIVDLRLEQLKAL